MLAAVRRPTSPTRSRRWRCWPRRIRRPIAMPRRSRCSKNRFEDAPELFSTLGQVYQDAGRWSDAARAFAGRRRRAAAESAAALAVGDRAAERRRRAARARGARRRIGGQLAQLSARCICCPKRSAARATIAAAEVTARRLIALDSRALGGPRQLAQIFLDQNEHQKIVALLEPIVTARLGAADAADLTSDTFRGTVLRSRDGLREAAAVRQGDRDAAGRRARCRRPIRSSRSGSRARSRKPARAKTPSGRCRRR